MPIGLVVPRRARLFEAVANGEPGPPLGRELEIADLLRFIREQRIRNVVWITGDVHYAPRTTTIPSRATFTDFNPFWEFVAGPAARRHVRAERARRHVRPRGAIRERQAGVARQQTSERRPPVFRFHENCGEDEGDDGGAKKPGGRDELQGRSRSVRYLDAETQSRRSAVSIYGEVHR